MTDRSLVHVAFYAALIAVLGLLPPVAIPALGGVPITAQTLGVMLAGIMLGPVRGSLAVLLFLFLVALGAPFLSGRPRRSRRICRSICRFPDWLAGWRLCRWSDHARDNQRQRPCFGGGCWRSWRNSCRLRLRDSRHFLHDRPFPAEGGHGQRSLYSR